MITLPSGPSRLTSLALPSGNRKTLSCNSTRRWQWLDPETRDALFAHARSRGVTPAMMTWNLSPEFAPGMAEVVVTRTVPPLHDMDVVDVDAIRSFGHDFG